MLQKDLLLVNNVPSVNASRYGKCDLGWILKIFWMRIEFLASLGIYSWFSVSLGRQTLVPKHPNDGRSIPSRKLNRLKIFCFWPGHVWSRSGLGPSGWVKIQVMLSCSWVVFVLAWNPRSWACIRCLDGCGTVCFSNRLRSGGFSPSRPSLLEPSFFSSRVGLDPVWYDSPK